MHITHLLRGEYFLMYQLVIRLLSSRLCTKSRETQLPPFGS